MEHPFLKAWADWKPVEPPFILRGDEEFISHQSCCYRSPHEYIESKHFNDPNDTDFHLALYPQPMLGNLAKAKVVFLLLNPGLKPGDYFAEFENQRFLEAVRRSLVQNLDGMEFPFVFLDPAFSWHSGFLWWTRKLKIVIEKVANQHALGPKDTLRWIAQRVASIELYPYHARNFKLKKTAADQLRSRELATSFVRELLVPRAVEHQVCIIVMRQAKAWGIEIGTAGVYQFRGGEAQGAHITQGHSIGNAVLEQLGLT